MTSGDKSPDTEVSKKAANSAAYDAWFKSKVQEALSEASATVPHQQVIDEAQALIDRKRRAGA